MTVKKKGIHLCTKRKSGLEREKTRNQGRKRYERGGIANHGETVAEIEINIEKVRNMPAPRFGKPSKHGVDGNTPKEHVWKKTRAVANRREKG